MDRQIEPTQTHGATTQAANSRPETPDPSQWHKKTSLADGTVIGRFGAYWYILDENGRAISEGYHDIYIDENGEYKGERSARIEPVTFHTESDL